MNFIASIDSPQSPAGPAYWFVFNGHSLLVSDENGRTVIPMVDQNGPRVIETSQRQFFGWWNDVPCYMSEYNAEGEIPNEAMSFKPVRSLVPLLGSEEMQVVGRAYQTLHWDRTSRFCGRCGSSTHRSSTEQAKACPKCGLIIYPRISPAVITAVVKDDTLLLASNKKIPGNRYSVLAGFVEPGETLEECVQREIREEVGIEVSDIRYFKSQPWSFPDSLMIGFTARYAGGDIKVDGREIVDAGWYRADALPNIPGPYSISRELIDWFVNR